ncbi:MAG: threonine synthase [Cyclobacteriaceae bacterium]
MRYYSTRNRSERATLKEAVLRGLAPDGGLYMPHSFPVLSPDFIGSLQSRSFQENTLTVATALFGEDLDEHVLRQMVESTITFDAPLVPLSENLYALELFHGPTAAFKDFGARFMSRMLGHFAESESRLITILAATSGDTGSAVANGFLGVPGTRVVVLYPSGKVSDIQEKQFTTLGENIIALEVEGSFDDCQRMVKEAFQHRELNGRMVLTSANSINLARLLPQTFYYFHALAQLPAGSRPMVSVPSGNFGNLTAGLIARKMGLPIGHFVAATNVNDIVPRYLQTGAYLPRASAATISNAMDVGDPSNFARMQDLFQSSPDDMKSLITGCTFSDDETKAAMLQVYQRHGYVMDPHGAVGYLGALGHANAGHPIIFLETAHPAKFKETVEQILKVEVPVPNTLQHFLRRKKQTIRLKPDFGALYETLVSESLAH